MGNNILRDSQNVTAKRSMKNGKKIEVAVPRLSVWYFVIVHKLVVLSTSPGKMKWSGGQ